MTCIGIVQVFFTTAKSGRYEETVKDVKVRMNITVIYGSEKKGSTYNIAQLFLQKVKKEGDGLTEFFLPRDMDKFCVGCSNCFARAESFCPHYEQMEPIRRAIERADFVVFTTPVYALRATGQMKALLDHFSFQYMTHRPNPRMFSKVALVISTGAGGGTKQAINDIATSLTFWGMARIYRYGTAVFAGDWEGVSDKSKRKITKKVNALSGRIGKSIGRVTPNGKTKLLFNLFRVFHIKKISASEADQNYWRDRGWLQKQRPWK